MIRSTLKVFEFFPQITARVEQAAVEGLNAAASEAAQVAQANASIDLQLQVQPAHGDVEGYSAGIVSRRQTSAAGKTTPIARFFDKGTLGKHRGTLKRPRKSSWTETSPAGNPYTAHRGDIAGKGIDPEAFFGKARAAGRRKLLARIEQELQ